MKTQHPIILVDGSSYLYRAFFATPPLTNSNGEPTGAIYGVTNMIRSLLNQYQTSHIAVIFDAKGGSFRNEIYSEYKATREAMPDDLRPQIEPIHNIIKAMGIPVLVIEGVEADDVIGTFAKQAEQDNQPVLISTGDKDMAQLVSSNITLLNTMNNTFLDPQGVIDKFGVPASKIIDFLALMGDSSDNIPGVQGVGEKTAVALLSHFDGIDDIYAHIDEVASLPIRGAKSVQKKLIENEGNARLSYLLATIKTDVDIGINYNELIRTSFNQRELAELFSYHGFNRWISELNNNNFIKIDDVFINQDTTSANDNNLDTQFIESSLFEEPSDIHYQAILNTSELNIWVDKLSQSQLFAFDTETNSLDHFHAQIVGLSFCITPNEACYIPLHHHYLNVPRQLSIDDVFKKLKPIFENESIKKVCQNSKFDYSILANYGIDVKGIVFDSMLESYVINSSERHDMDSLAAQYLNRKTISYAELMGGNKKQTIDMLNIELVSHYACEDADITLQLHQTLWPILEKTPKLLKLFTEIEMPLALILARMERTGVLVDEQRLYQISKELTLELEHLEQTIHLLAGERFNIASPKQLQVILFEKLGIPPLKKTPKGEPSTSEEVLSELANSYDLPKLILEYRGLAKLKNTYSDKLPKMISQKDGRIHTNFNQVGTVTGRLSSNDPNLQNIPVRNQNGRRIRQAFIAPKGYKIVSADYSQIELRIMAHLSQDKNLLEAFAHNKDIHRVTASEVLGKPENEVSSEERRQAKAVNFGLIYGMSAFGLAKQINVSRTEAQQYIDKYFERYPGVQAYMNDTRLQASDKGYVETLTGRRLYLPRIKSSNAIERKGAERAAINAPMQGTAADIIKSAMIKMNDYIEINASSITMVLQVHDELVFEVADDKIDEVVNQIKLIMENCYKLDVPLKVDVGVGNNWDEAH